MEYKAFSEGSSWETYTGESLEISRKVEFTLMAPTFAQDQLIQITDPS